MTATTPSKLRDQLAPVLALATIIPALHLLGSGPLTAPPLLEPSALHGWMSETEAVVVSFSILRLGALVAAYHLAATLLLAGSGRLFRRRSLITLARRLSPAAYRGLIERIAGIGLSTTILVGAPVPVSAEVPSTTEAAVEQTIEHPSGTATMRLDPPGGQAELRLVDPPSSTRVEVPPARPAEPVPVGGTEPEPTRTDPDTTSSTTEAPGTTESESTTRPAPSDTTGSTTDDGESPAAERNEEPGSSHRDGHPTTVGTGEAARHRETGDHVVEPGDHLWALAEARLADHHGRTVTDQEIAPYWRRVVDANPHLGDPDLIFPGDVVTLPAPD